MESGNIPVDARYFPSGGVEVMMEKTGLRPGPPRPFFNHDEEISHNVPWSNNIIS
jgi:hypothetical protein